MSHVSPRTPRSRRLFATAAALAFALGAAACQPEYTASEGSPLSTLPFTENFEGLPAGVGWNVGEVNGGLYAAQKGGGSVYVEQTTSDTKVLHLSPAKPGYTSGGTTALVLSTGAYGDHELRLRLRTVRQLRSTPRSWEVGGVSWHRADATRYYYLLLKPNGYELGKMDPSASGGKRYLVTSSARTFPIGAWYDVRVVQQGGRITAYVNGSQLLSFEDTQSPYLAGQLGIFAYTAHVHADDLSVTEPAGAVTDGGTPPAADGGTTVPVADGGTATDGGVRATDGGTVADGGTSTDGGTVADGGTIPPPTSGNRYIPTPLYGVTTDQIGNLSDIVTSLKNLSRKPTTRIVFDEFQPASGYRTAAQQIYGVSYVMGEILDSFYMPQYTVAQFKSRVTEYLTALGDVVDIWEVGNEINGEWLGTNADVVAKMTDAYNQVKAAGKTAALTLYYNQDCWSRSSNEMFTWRRTTSPPR